MGKKSWLKEWKEKGRQPGGGDLSVRRGREKLGGKKRRHKERKEREMTTGEERRREQEAANGVPQVTDLTQRAEGCAAAP